MPVIGLPTNKAGWRQAVVYALLAQPIDVVLAMIDGGEDEFVRVCRQKFTGHGFTGFDYRQIFKALTGKVHDKGWRQMPVGQSVH